MSAMFCTSRTSCAPRRTSSSGLYAADLGSVGLNSRQCEKRERQPAVMFQFSPFMAQILAVMQAEKDTGRTGQSGLADFFGIGPACGAVGRDQLGLPRAPDRHADGNHHSDQATGTGDGTTRVEDVRRVLISTQT